MKFCCRNNTTFWFCFLGLLALGSCYPWVSNRESKGKGIFKDQPYNDPVGEFTGDERRPFAYGTKEDSENDNVAYDESQDDVRAQDYRAWVLGEIENYRKRLQSEENDDESDSKPVRGETEEDRLALLREEATNRRQQEALKRRGSARKEQKLTESDVPKTGHLFEGDIVMSDHFRSHLTAENSKRDALVDKEYLWEKKDGIVRVPYSVDKNFNELKRERLRQAVDDFNKYTCITFEPKQESDDDHVHFFSNKSMCYSSVGKQGGKQKISIGDGCERKGTVIHEMLHSIGFIHEQSRPDRDKYVKVVWENIKKRLKHNFQKYPRYLVDDLGIGYDFDSVLHYHNSAFTKNGEDTLIDKADPSRKFGQRIGFSKRNIEQVNKLYGCDVDPHVMDDVQFE
ncbi:zinc metalloproteinase nas-4-like isoform X2 [Actinia tenebrosa]|uniref:Metalloendopeptidase n=1 Tax=Actinia tenebrosa TaxID=6105 RepID=A0A6P8IW81_ACTTE|nr:zinc metalloproteinase nas-4-like isoform X2 [Actinia tenebrosa]